MITARENWARSSGRRHFSSAAYSGLPVEIDLRFGGEADPRGIALDDFEWPAALADLDLDVDKPRIVPRTSLRQTRISQPAAACSAGIFPNIFGDGDTVEGLPLRLIFGAPLPGGALSLLGGGPVCPT
jgi:hypothetical protein